MMENVQPVMQLSPYKYTMPWPRSINDRLIKIIQQIFAPKILTFDAHLKVEKYNNNDSQHNKHQHENTLTNINTESNTETKTEMERLKEPGLLNPVRLINAIDITFVFDNKNKDEYVLQVRIFGPYTGILDGVNDDVSWYVVGRLLSFIAQIVAFYMR